MINLRTWHDEQACTRRIDGIADWAQDVTSIGVDFMWTVAGNADYARLVVACAARFERRSARCLRQSR